MASGSSCQDIAIIGARGSGAKYSPDKVDNNGPVSTALNSYLKKLNNDRKVGVYSLSYPAAAVTASNVFNGELFKSIDQGVDQVSSFLRERMSRCSNERYVLVGYSQGAMVMHRALFQIAKNQLASNSEKILLNRIDGVLAIADGDRLANQGGHHYGTAPASTSGVSWEFTYDGNKYKPVNKPLTDLPEQFANRYHDVCAEKDIVCDTDRSSLADGISIHSYSYQPGTSRHSAQSIGALDSAANSIANESNSHPTHGDSESPSDQASSTSSASPLGSSPH